MPSPWQTIPPDDRPQVEVLVNDGQWCPGEVRARRHRDGVWEAWVTYASSPGENGIGTFTFDQLRLAQDHR